MMAAVALRRGRPAATELTPFVATSSGQRGTPTSGVPPHRHATARFDRGGAPVRESAGGWISAPHGLGCSSRRDARSWASLRVIHAQGRAVHPHLAPTPRRSLPQPAVYSPSTHSPSPSPCSSPPAGLPPYQSISPIFLPSSNQSVCIGVGSGKPFSRASMLYR